MEFPEFKELIRTQLIKEHNLRKAAIKKDNAKEVSTQEISNMVKEANREFDNYRADIDSCDGLGGLLLTLREYEDDDVEVIDIITKAIIDI